MYGLTINIASFAHLLKRVDFDAVVDHLAIKHITKSKMEPATYRIKRLLEALSSYSFNLYYIKGKDMILSDFLSRQIKDDSNPYEIIPISFHIWEILQESYLCMVTDTYKVQMRAQAKAQTSRPIVVNAQPKAQKTAPEIVKMPIRTEKKRDIKMPASEIIQQPPRNIVFPPGSVLSPVIMPPHVRPPPKPPNVNKAATGPDLGPNPNMDIEENSLYQEVIITETYVAPD